MSLISVNNLTFGYEGSINNVFENVSVSILNDTFLKKFLNSEFFHFLHKHFKLKVSALSDFLDFIKAHFSWKNNS